VHVTFKMIDRDQRLVERVRERLAVGDAPEQGAHKGRAVGDADGVKVGEGEARLRQGFADYRDDLAQMFARGEFGNYSAVFAVNVDLRGDNRRKNVAAVGDDGGSGFVAGRFDAEDAGGG